MLKTTARTLVLLICCANQVSYAAEASPLEQNEPNASWIDSSHGFVVNQADALVGWVDSFFGRIRTDQEAAQSFLRLKLQDEWDEEDGNSLNLRLRGRVELPQISKRLGLIFADESGDPAAVNEGFNRHLSNEQSNTEVALQYTSRDDERSRVDFKLGLPSLKLKVAARYRYRRPLSPKLFARFTEEVSFRDGLGFVADTRLDFDYVLNESRVVRLSGRTKYGKETAGVEWSSSIELNERIDAEQAISLFANVGGVTRADYDCTMAPSICQSRERSPWLTEAFGVGLRYRRNVLRRWLFVELEPTMLRRRRAQIDGGRESVLVMTARLEILLHRQLKSSKS